MSLPRLARSPLTSLLRARPNPTPLFNRPSTSTSSYSAPIPANPHSRFPTSYCRSFASTSSSLASEAPQSPFEARGFQSEVPLFERLQQHPEVLEAIERLAQTVKSKTGVDLQGGEAPTMKMMMTLARDPDLRAAAEGLMLALKSAGIEVDPQQAFKALQMMGGEGFEGTKGLDSLHDAVRKGEGEEGDGEGRK